MKIPEEIKYFLVGVVIGLGIVFCTAVLIGCTTTNINIPPNSQVHDITVNANKNVNTSPSIKADGNTVPVSAVP